MKNILIAFFFFSLLTTAFAQKENDRFMPVVAQNVLPVKGVYYLVDGKKVEMSAVAGIDPNTIEKVEVLKKGNEQFEEVCKKENLSFDTEGVILISLKKK